MRKLLPVFAINYLYFTHSIHIDFEVVKVSFPFAIGHYLVLLEGSFTPQLIGHSQGRLCIDAIGRPFIGGTCCKRWRHHSCSTS